MIREPAVCGQFYPDNTLALVKQIESFLPKDVNKNLSAIKRETVIGTIIPHAGYAYSGRVAVETISHIEEKCTFIVIGPNHSGLGPEFSIQTEGSWLTPLGEIKIDEQLAKQLLKNSKFLKEDTLAHKFEHSIEVELPILQYFFKNFKFIPIVIMSSNFNDCIALGKEIASIIKKLKLEEKVTVIASSDMTHYEEHNVAVKKDKEAIDAILKLDIELFTQTIANKHITMCGFAPTTVLLSYAKAFDAKKTKLIKYQTSGDSSGDYSSVVGYAGITIK